KLYPSVVPPAPSSSANSNQREKRFYVSTDVQAWFNARLTCMSCFEDLAVINSAEKALSVPSTSFTMWIGYRLLADGPYVWVDENQTAYESWAQGEPDSNNVCVYISSYKMWHTYNCQYSMQYLCQEGKDFAFSLSQTRSSS
uniref:C-type lectin domain-containing protein n=1 Tax=Erpetoichthys calabaricus TaxID=27687 RepID=A0A8C4RVB0_ERPCA